MVWIFAEMGLSLTAPLQLVSCPKSMCSDSTQNFGFYWVDALIVTADAQQSHLSWGRHFFDTKKKT